MGCDLLALDLGTNPPTSNDGQHNDYYSAQLGIPKNKQRHAQAAYSIQSETSLQKEEFYNGRGRTPARGEHKVGDYGDWWWYRRDGEVSCGCVRRAEHGLGFLRVFFFPYSFVRL